MNTKMMTAPTHDQLDQKCGCERCRNQWIRRSPRTYELKLGGISLLIHRNAAWKGRWLATTLGGISLLIHRNAAWKGRWLATTRGIPLFFNSLLDSTDIEGAKVEALEKLNNLSSELYDKTNKAWLVEVSPKLGREKLSS